MVGELPETEVDASLAENVWILSQGGNPVTTYDYKNKPIKLPDYAVHPRANALTGLPGLP